MDKILPEEQLGIFDFLKMFYEERDDEYLAFALASVKAPIEKVARVFLEYRQSLKGREKFGKANLTHQNIHWQQKMSIRPSRKEQRYAMRPHFFYDGCDVRTADRLLFIKVSNNDWTTILCPLFCIDWDIVTDLPEIAQNLSSRLQTNAIIFTNSNSFSCSSRKSSKILIRENEKSFTMRYNFFYSFDLIEEFEYGGDGYIHFESKFRKQSEIDFNWEAEHTEQYRWLEKPGFQFIDKFFSQLGIYLPACLLVNDESEIVLAVEDYENNTIERVDWIELQEIWEDDIPEDLPF